MGEREKGLFGPVPNIIFGFLVLHRGGLSIIVLL